MQSESQCGVQTPQGLLGSNERKFISFLEKLPETKPAENLMISTDPSHFVLRTGGDGPSITEYGVLEQTAFMARAWFEDKLMIGPCRAA